MPITSPQPSVPSRKRIRLAPKVRSDKILESAVVEFSRCGFASTRIEDIARGAGLSKSGFYAHFQSKEEVFEALLTRFLITQGVIPFDATDTVDVFIDRFLDFCYTDLENPHRQAVLRLLLTEMHRVPALINEWNSNVVEPAMKAQLKVLQAAAERGQLDRPLTLEDYSFAYAPLLYWILSNHPHVNENLTFTLDLSRHRERHRQMMRAMLQGPTPKTPVSSR